MDARHFARSMTHACATCTVDGQATNFLTFLDAIIKLTLDLCVYLYLAKCD